MTMTIVIFCRHFFKTWIKHLSPSLYAHDPTSDLGSLKCHALQGPSTAYHGAALTRKPIHGFHSPWACCLLWPRDESNRSLGTGRGSWRRNREKLAVVARLHRVGCRGGPSPQSCVGCDLAGASRWWTLRQAGSPYPGPEGWILHHNKQHKSQQIHNNNNNNNNTAPCSVKKMFPSR